MTFSYVWNKYIVNYKKNWSHNNNYEKKKYFLLLLIFWSWIIITQKNAFIIITINIKIQLKKSQTVNSFLIYISWLKIIFESSLLRHSVKTKQLNEPPLKMCFMLWKEKKIITWIEFSTFFYFFFNFLNK
jgi:hypothetical protein